MKDLALLVLRLSGLYLALAHGLGKVLSLASGGGEQFVAGVEKLGFPAPTAFAWAAAAAECAGGALVAAGLYTRIAAGAAAFTMFVAAFLGHHAHLRALAAAGVSTYSQETIEGWGNPEMALLYLIALLAVLLLGPGRFSLDAALRGKGKGRSGR